MKKIIITVLMVVTFMTVLAGCGSKEGNIDKKLVGEWNLVEVSNDTPIIFPTDVPNMCIASKECRMNLLSDGSVIVKAEGMSSDKTTYEVVDGQLKITAPLGSISLCDYKISGDELTITDSEGNYAVFNKGAVLWKEKKAESKEESAESDINEEEEDEIYPSIGSVTYEKMFADIGKEELDSFVLDYFYDNDPLYLSQKDCNPQAECMGTAFISYGVKGTENCKNVLMYLYKLTYSIDVYNYYSIEAVYAKDIALNDQGKYDNITFSIYSLDADLMNVHNEEEFNEFCKKKEDYNNEMYVDGGFHLAHNLFYPYDNNRFLENNEEFFEALFNDTARWDVTIESESYTEYFEGFFEYVKDAFKKLGETMYPEKTGKNTGEFMQ